MGKIDVLACKVSSVLSNDTKEYGKKFMFDNQSDTCWNSDRGDTQHIQLKFNQIETISKLCVQFQGGFAAKTIDFVREGSVVCTVYPGDENTEQMFELPSPVECQGVKLLLRDMTDFYGRIIVYKLELLS